MYNSLNIAENIKNTAKMKKVTVKCMLADLDLSVNTLQNMKTSMPKSDTIARIADYLNCSVDYLLGRTDNPEIRTDGSINQSNIIGDNTASISNNAPPAPSRDSITDEFIKNFGKLDFGDKLEVMNITMQKTKKGE